MRQSVKIVFDRKKQAVKTGRGKIELYTFISQEQKQNGKLLGHLIPIVGKWLHKTETFRQR